MRKVQIGVTLELNSGVAVGSYDRMVQSAAAIILGCATEMRAGVTVARQSELTRAMLLVRQSRDAVRLGDDRAAAAVRLVIPPPQRTDDAIVVSLSEVRSSPSS